MNRRSSRTRFGLLQLSIIFLSLAPGLSEAGLKIYYIRHAEGGHNVRKAWEAKGVPKSEWPSYVGNPNVFTPRGLKEVVATTEKLQSYSFDFIASSNAWRARNTILPYLKVTQQTAEVWPELREGPGMLTILSKDIPELDSEILNLGDPIELPEEEKDFFVLRKDSPNDYKSYPRASEENVKVAYMKHVSLHAIDMIEKRFGGTEKSILLAGHNSSGVSLLKLLLKEEPENKRGITSSGIWMVEQQGDGTYQLKMYNSEVLTPEKKRVRQDEVFSEVNTEWAKRRYDKARSLCQTLVNSSDAAIHFRSYAHLRLAQSYVFEGNQPAARTTYLNIAQNESYPKVHREEAKALADELGHSSQDLASSTRTEVPAVSKFAAEVFVSTKGNDANTGSRQSPFATLRRARDEVRAIKQRGLKGAVAVTMMPGQYKLRKSLTLEAEDSGDALGPIVYRAQEEGTVVFYGGETISGFEPIRDAEIKKRLPAESRDEVWQCNLKSLGIHDYGQLKVRGFAQPPSPPTVELFVDGAAMTLARWPNQGFVGIDELVNPGSRSTGEPSVFKYESDRHERWTDASDGWLSGYFQFLWADATIKIGKIDPSAKTLTTAEPYHYNGRGMSTHQGIQYYAFNLLEEIDQPGEWYLDRETGMLYLYPASDPEQSTIEIGMLSKPMITMDTVSHVRIEGLGFDLARYNGIEAKNCSHCSFIGCTVSRMAGNGVMINGGQENQLIGCEIHSMGRTATEVSGGDRQTLTPGRHLVENCRIHNFGRIDRTYTPALKLDGVGHRVAHNLMYDGPSSAIRVGGNDHLIEYNEIHSMAQESDDQGAIDMYGNPTFRGIVFRYNYFHDIGKTGTEMYVHGQSGIRFDDVICDMVVYGNVFYRSANGNFGAIQMNGGRDNLMENNIFIDCKQGISGGWYPSNKFWKAMREGQMRRGFYENELYLSRYPKIATMMEEPGRNHVWRNVFYQCERVFRSPSNVDDFEPALIDLFENGVFEDDPGFVDYKNGDFRLRKDARLFDTMCFAPIPFGQIGTYETHVTAREIHVAKGENNASTGSQESPYLTINKAAAVARPGDTITVHAGTYREWVKPVRGGSSEQNRITYRVAPGDDVYIKGSERVTTWEKQDSGLWKVVIPNSFFDNTNPYALKVSGGWLNYGQWHHRGDVYLNGEAYYEKETTDEVALNHKSWHCQVDEKVTTILANFGELDPNKEMAEINVRESLFMPEISGLKYITVDGFHFEHAASNWAPPVIKLQTGAVGPRMGKCWIIENCTIVNSRCVGIILGQAPGVDYGDIDAFGDHIIRNNIIQHCGQAGIAGQRGATRSLISGNLIEDTNVRKEFGGWETSAIKFHHSVDTVIENNLIRGVYHQEQGAFGIWIDYGNQGTRISRNIIYDTQAATVFLEMNHGPILVDNNILVGNDVRSNSEATVFAHNLFVDCGHSYRPDLERRSSYYKPHTLETAGRKPGTAQDDKWFNNIFVRKGLDDVNEAPGFGSNYNIFLEGAKKSAFGDQQSVVDSFDTKFNRKDSANGVTVSFFVQDKHFPTSSPWVDENLVGVFPTVGQTIEDRYGNALTVDTDFAGEKRSQPLAGPLANKSAGSYAIEWKALSRK